MTKPNGSSNGGGSGNSSLTPEEVAARIKALEQEKQELEKRFKGAVSAKDKLANELKAKEQEFEVKQKEFEAQLETTKQELTGHKAAAEAAEKLKQAWDQEKTQMTDATNKLKGELLRAEAIADAGGQIIAELVPATIDEGDLKEKVDAAKRKYAEIADSVRQQMLSQMVPPTKPPVEGAKEFTVGEGEIRDYILEGKTPEEREKRRQEVIRFVEQRKPKVIDDGGRLYPLG